MSEKKYRLNDRIRISPVILIDKDGKNLGPVSLNKAKYIARSSNLDLVEVSPNSRPPVCKVLDFNKFKYDQDIKNKKQKVKNVIKEIRLSCGIAEHDLETKSKHAIKFLQSDYKVNIKLEFKRRENNHKEIGREVVDNFLEKIKDYSNIIKKPSLDGRFIFCSIEPKKIK